MVKSCLLSYQKNKVEFEKKKKAKNKASNNADLKQKKDRFRSNYQST